MNWFPTFLNPWSAVLAGAQLLLLAMLQRAKATLDKLVTVAPVCPTGPDIAQAIRARNLFGHGGNGHGVVSPA